MKTTGQHELHPGAELLSAFAEHAVGEGERRQVLAHLAVCCRCREVLALAQQAAEVRGAELDEVAVPAAAVAVAGKLLRRHVPWWRSWHFAWAPVAALTAGVALAVYVHTIRVERSAEMAKNTAAGLSQNETEGISAPQQAASEPERQAQPAAPPPPAPGVRALPRPFAKTANAASAPRSVAEPSTAGLPPRSESESVMVVPTSPAIETESAQQVAPLPAVGSPTVYRVPSLPVPPRPEAQAELKRKSDDRNRRITTDAAGHPSYAAAAMPTFATQNGNAAIAGEANSSAAAQNQAEPRTSASALGAIGGARASFGIAAKPIHLPSGLAVASIAHVNQHTLAIDSVGAVFLSEDRGATWRPVTPLWTGRAILVRTRTVPGSPAPDVSAKSADAVSGVPASDAFFEIVNDKNEVWISSDGTTWSPR